jgi:hypothetical protein
MSEVYGQQLLPAPCRDWKKYWKQSSSNWALCKQKSSSGALLSLQPKNTHQSQYGLQGMPCASWLLFSTGSGHTPEELYQQAMDLALGTISVGGSHLRHPFRHQFPLIWSQSVCITEAERCHLRSFPKAERSPPGCGHPRSGHVVAPPHFGNKVTISWTVRASRCTSEDTKRGKHVAPMSEVLAAGLLYLVRVGCRSYTFGRWHVRFRHHRHRGRIDGHAKSAQHARKYFPFKQWRDHNPGLYQEVREDLMQYSRSQVPDIRGYDISPQYIRSAPKMPAVAGVGQYVRFESSPFADTEAPQSKRSVVAQPALWRTDACGRM